MGNVLLIDADRAFADGLAEELRARGHTVCCEAEFADNSLQNAERVLGETPAVVLLGYDAALPVETICAAIKEIRFAPRILFLATDPTSADLRRAYASGGDGFLRKPLNIGELVAKIQRAEDDLQQRRQTDALLEQTRVAAFAAMSMSSELGEILRFLQHALQCDNYADIAAHLFSLLDGIGLHGSLKIIAGDDIYYFSDQATIPADEQAHLANADIAQRLLEHEQTLTVAEQHCILFVRDMPIHDTARQGMLRDTLCILLAVITARVHALVIAAEAERRRRVLGISLKVMTRIIEEMDTFNVGFTERNLAILDEMVMHLTAEYSVLDLNEQEEKNLVNILDSSSHQINVLFDNKRAQDDTVRIILKKLVNSISI